MEELKAVECVSCEEGMTEICEKSKRECGHHCNHSIEDAECCWCGKIFGEPDELEC